MPCSTKLGFPSGIGSCDGRSGKVPPHLAERSSLCVAIVANDHIQQYDSRLFALDPIGRIPKRPMAMIASQHDAFRQASSVPLSSSDKNHSDDVIFDAILRETSGLIKISTPISLQFEFCCRKILLQ